MTDNIDSPEGQPEFDPFDPASFTPAPTKGQDKSSLDPFAASNFESNDNALDNAIEGSTFELGAPNEESFVRVSEDPRHTATVTCLVTSREGGFGKTFSMLTPLMKGWASKQPSLTKFVKTYHVYLFQTSDDEYGLWPVADSFDSWSMSDLQVVAAAKQGWVRRYNAGRQRRAHLTDSIKVEPTWPKFGMFTGDDGTKGLLARAFGEGFLISSPDHPTLQKLLR